MNTRYTITLCPGMIGAMVRHLKSLRRMTRDHGWIHTLLEEAENERMHLLTALELRRPGPLFKFAVIGTQDVHSLISYVYTCPPLSLSLHHTLHCIGCEASGSACNGSQLSTRQDQQYHAHTGTQTGRKNRTTTPQERSVLYI